MGKKAIAMQSRKPVKAALANQIDAVRQSISLLQSEVGTGSRPNRKSWRSGYELKAKKERLARLEKVLADYPSGRLGQVMAPFPKIARPLSPMSPLRTLLIKVAGTFLVTWSTDQTPFDIRVSAGSTPATGNAAMSVKIHDP
ncbi:hypothetical protein P9272_29780 [Mesorhizobium sp. WSM4976]|uniref:hypothetical protein n=1 Tax=Mesorhizobium sp. WSM4976 TaxID=3038549 RepID=UPI00241761FA|nr:hypothetical protein [Mesorhizobium sp. WSM4976]MDG4897733.1 hypothetical protein [Mesorhizobium sp. WSM4976]